MKIIVPMAGRGSRLRPHTLSVPKPLVPIAGQPIVHRLVKDIAKVVQSDIEEIAFILGDPAFFGEDVIESLTGLAEDLGARATIYRQDEPLGTGHAIMCAKDSLDGPAVIAYADTLIRADLHLDPSADAVIWVKQVENPETYGVVQLNDRSEIVELVEKPQEFVGDLAVIGIYYFKDVRLLRNELQYVLDNDIISGGEYQINDGIKRMMANGKVFKPGEVQQWMDCGNKQVVIDTNKRVLDNEFKSGIDNVSTRIEIENSVIIQPCFIGENVKLKNAVIGPHVSIGNDSTVTDSVISNSIIQQSSQISQANIKCSMIGSNVTYTGVAKDLSIGDYTTIHE